MDVMDAVLARGEGLCCVNVVWRAGFVLGGVSFNIKKDLGRL